MNCYEIVLPKVKTGKQEALFDVRIEVHGNISESLKFETTAKLIRQAVADLFRNYQSPEQVTFSYSPTKSTLIQGKEKDAIESVWQNIFGSVTVLAGGIAEQDVISINEISPPPQTPTNNSTDLSKDDVSTEKEGIAFHQANNPEGIKPVELDENDDSDVENDIFHDFPAENEKGDFLVEDKKENQKNLSSESVDTDSSKDTAHSSLSEKVETSSPRLKVVDISKCKTEGEIINAYADSYKKKGIKFPEFSWGGITKLKEISEQDLNNQSNPNKKALRLCKKLCEIYGAEKGDSQLKKEGMDDELIAMRNFLLSLYKFKLRGLEKETQRENPQETAASLVLDFLNFKILEESKIPEEPVDVSGLKEFLINYKQDVTI
jgi:hypothetical protein